MAIPMKEQSGLLVLEDPEGRQTWALVVDAVVEYGSGDAGFTANEPPEMKVIATLPPGEQLRYASSHEVDEVNVLTYSRLLVSVLREERERYAELEREMMRARQERVEAIERRDADMHYAWQDGAVQGWIGHLKDRTPAQVLEKNPHPAPDFPDDEENY